MDPSAVDLSAFPGLNADVIRAYIETQMDYLRALGFEVTSCLIDTAETAEAVVEAALDAQRFDCVVIGAGLREPPTRLLLFERVINLVHAMAPAARICFNTTPADTVEAVQRWATP